MLNFLPVLAALASLASATTAPHRPGLKLLWKDEFTGCQGCTPKDDNWNTALNINSNNELQVYSTSNKNIQLSGGDTLQLVPWKDGKGEWTSGRLESKKAWHADKNKALRVEASIRMGDSARKQGMWPAFWMLGDALRHGTGWPLCGEIDIFERVNGDMTGFGTVHCGHEGGGPCNEPEGLGQRVTIPDNDFHAWSVVIDRRAASWQDEKITWLLDGTPFHSISGKTLNDEGTWATLAHSPMYVLLNVAVGGNWPGNPNKATEPGYKNMMEVAYVAVYETTK
ncbi:hypothetical protein FPOAC2_02882 [Fusarium poae]|uniref:GH16 domain-containing protein n=1 Tax=Fusarium poae TaxID=36050 RepID=A0A1B8B7L1_FUSPO|nr:hypothetical protein FPOAC1_002779 [Fusarium poae]KAG8676771.1 hypothetical protein FPOAC1_002779 [Fusarium poae]OBS28706.1 hypothetical protein FPOA_02644 [Fusarium poae]